MSKGSEKEDAGSREQDYGSESLRIVDGRDSRNRGSGSEIYVDFHDDDNGGYSTDDRWMYEGEKNEFC